MTDKRLVFATAGSADEARRIAQALVERKLAACVNMVPGVTSIYRWNGKVEEGAEWLLLIKTTESLFPRVRETIRELHSYELPECISISVEDGLPEYLSWIGECVGEEGGGP